MPARKPWWGDAIKSDFAKYYSTAEKAQNDDGVMIRPAARNTASFGVIGFGSFTGKQVIRQPTCLDLYFPNFFKNFLGIHFQLTSLSLDSNSSI